MDDAQLMGVVQGFGSLDAQPGDSLEELPAGVRALGGEGSLKRLRSVGGNCRWLIADCGLGRVIACGRSSPRGLLQVCNLQSQICNYLSQALSVDVLHCIEMQTAFGADEIDGYDAGVVQLGRCVRFVLETLELACVHGCRERQHLEG